MELVMRIGVLLAIVFDVMVVWMTVVGHLEAFAANAGQISVDRLFGHVAMGVVVIVLTKMSLAVIVVERFCTKMPFIAVVTFTFVFRLFFPSHKSFAAIQLAFVSISINTREPFL
jgi:hypothetical protein